MVDHLPEGAQVGVDEGVVVRVVPDRELEGGGVQGLGAGEVAGPVVQVGGIAGQQRGGRVEQGQQVERAGRAGSVDLAAALGEQGAVEALDGQAAQFLGLV